MKKEKIKNRGFGILFFFLFLLIGLYPIYKGLTPNLYLVILSIPFLILGLINSKILTPLNKAWVKLGEILGLVIAPVVMVVIYFVVLTPISFIVRIFGKDLLGVKFSKKIQSYWIDRKKNLGPMKNQF